MIDPSIQRLHFLCDLIPPLLYALGEDSFSASPAAGGWSKKEVLGHLIDSATNNHRRFVRGQFEDTPRITYDQDAWNAHSYYNGMDSSQLIRFWECYNRQLLALIAQIPQSLLGRVVDTGGEAPFTIAFLIDDYVAHAEHHLHQIVNY